MLQDPDLSTWRPSPASQAWVNQVSCSTPILPASVVTWSLIPLFPSLDCKLLEGKGLAIFILIESNLILSLAQLNLSTCLTKKNPYLGLWDESHWLVEIIGPWLYHCTCMYMCNYSTLLPASAFFGFFLVFTIMLCRVARVGLGTHYLSVFI